jgi:hypothetical protein
LAFFAQTTASFCKTCDHNIGFWEKRQFFRRKLSKIAENCDHNIDPWSCALQADARTTAARAQWMHFATTYVGAGNGRIGQDVNARKFTTSDPSLHTSFDLAQSANINPSSISKKNLQILEQREGSRVAWWLCGKNRPNCSQTHFLS